MLLNAEEFENTCYLVLKKELFKSDGPMIFI